MITTQFQVDVPSWVATAVAATGGFLPSLDDRMALAIHLAERNFRDGGGGPFAAIVVERSSGRIISAGVNRVLASNLSVSHAEVVALSLAQCRLGTWDLGAKPGAPTELVVNWRPCLQCCGAVLWSGISHLVIPDDSDELERLTGFDEGPVPADWVEQFERRGVAVTRGVQLPEALRVFRDFSEWVDQGRAVVYNARGTGVNVGRGTPASESGAADSG
ncbi:MAG: nucleoside deaminase [Propionibacteriaceae bacterium]|nr:nucleoside deaminase [Propionibacteriaceae bacterium]